MTAKTRLVATWWCRDCDERSDPQHPLTMAEADKDAARHVTETRHATVTSYRPRR